MTYLINLLFIPFYYFLITKIYKDKRRRDKIFILVFGLHAIIFRALANPFNYVDTEGYAIAYENLSSMTAKEALTSMYVSWGPGYVLVNWLLSRVSSDPLLLFIFLSVFTIGGIVWFYKKTSLSPFATCIIFVIYPMLYMNSFGVIRQPFSIVFLLLALYYIDNLKISIPLAFTAILLHTSAIVFIPFYIWKFLKIGKKNLFIVLFFIIVGFISLRYMMQYILSYFERYQISGFGDEGDRNLLPILLLGTITLAFYLSNTHKRLQTNTEKNVFSFIIYGLMVSLFGFGLQGAGRLSLVFMYVFPVAITYLKKYSDNKFWYYICLSMTLSVLTLVITSTYDPIRYDYKAVWEKVVDYK